MHSVPDEAGRPKQLSYSIIMFAITEPSGDHPRPRSIRQRLQHCSLRATTVGNGIIIYGPWSEKSTSLQIRIADRETSPYEIVCRHKYGKLERGAVDIKKRTSIAIKPVVDQMAAILDAEQKPHPHPHSLQSGYSMIAHRSGPERLCGQRQFPRQVSPSGNRDPPASTAGSQSTSLQSRGASLVNAWTLLTSYNHYIIPFCILTVYLS